MIEKVNQKASLTLRVNTGTSSNPAYANRIFNNINPELTTAKSYATLNLLGGLQAHTVEKFIRTDTAELVEND